MKLFRNATFGFVMSALIVFVVACATGTKHVRYVHKATGKRLAVRADGKIDLSSLSGLAGSGGSSSSLPIGLITQIVGSGCSSTSTSGITDANGNFFSLLSNLIPPELTQSGVTVPPTSCDFCKTLLTPPQAAQLQILFQYFGGEILLDGVHDLTTCPILAWGAQIYNPYEAGTITAAQYALGMLHFLGNKSVQNLNGNQTACYAALRAAGFTPPSGEVSLP